MLNSLRKESNKDNEAGMENGLKIEKDQDEEKHHTKDNESVNDEPRKPLPFQSDERSDYQRERVEKWVDNVHTMEEDITYEAKEMKPAMENQ